MLAELVCAQHVHVMLFCHLGLLLHPVAFVLAVTFSTGSDFLSVFAVAAVEVSSACAALGASNPLGPTLLRRLMNSQQGG